MKCFSCDIEFDKMSYVVMPLLNLYSCMNCWTVAEPMYYATYNNAIRSK